MGQICAMSHPFSDSLLDDPVCLHSFFIFEFRRHCCAFLRFSEPTDKQTKKNNQLYLGKLQSHSAEKSVEQCFYVHSHKLSVRYSKFKFDGGKNTEKNKISSNRNLQCKQHAARNAHCL